VAVHHRIAVSWSNVTPVLWLGDEVRAKLSSQQLAGARNVHSLDELLAAMQPARVVVFVDRSTIPQLAQLHPSHLQAPIVAVSTEAASPVHGWLAAHPWLSHVTTAALLDLPLGRDHLANVLGALATGEKPRLLDWVPASVTGRRIRLTHASRRIARLERMGEFLCDHGLDPAASMALRAVAESLLVYTFYEAPIAAGALRVRIPIHQDIALPDDRACDLAYGCREDLAIVRVCDPFGSMSRAEAIELFTRFSAATYVAISINKGRSSEVLVGMARQEPRSAGPDALHLFSRDTGKRRFWRPERGASLKPSAANRSVMLVSKK
jgi:hypothetical protein